MGTTLSTCISDLSEEISLALGRHSQNQRIVKSSDLEKTFKITLCKETGDYPKKCSIVLKYLLIVL